MGKRRATAINEAEIHPWTIITSLEVVSRSGSYSVLYETLLNMFRSDKAAH
ncbi:hypothetical protein YERSI8AC_60061 [Enterobacterales bacterium 8AC]|nr:hypothetical protein YERSI8AC_60061 [Enterobacterales bacterium 8AC]